MRAVEEAGRCYLSLERGALLSAVVPTLPVVGLDIGPRDLSVERLIFLEAQHHVLVPLTAEIGLDAGQALLVQVLDVGDALLVSVAVNSTHLRMARGLAHLEVVVAVLELFRRRKVVTLRQREQRECDHDLECAQHLGVKRVAAKGFRDGAGGGRNRC